jgi:hypothetical protein
MMPETLRNFNPAALRLLWHDRRWLLVCDNEVLKDLGVHEREARAALRLIQELGVNQYGTAGAPQPVMEYWLINGKPPQGRGPAGLHTLALDQASLRVEQVQGQWRLREAHRVLFSFGYRADEANRALAVVRRYGFTHVGFLGHDAPVLYVFFAASGGGPAVLANAQPTHSSSRQMATPRFPRLAKDANGKPRMEKSGPGLGLEALTPALPPLAQPGAGGKDGWRGSPQRGGLSPAPVDTGRMAFDWRQVQMRQDQGEWKLMAGQTELENFGVNVQDARMALSAVRYYRFTERWRASGERPADYYLANGQSPRGMLFGLRGEAFEPDKVEVKEEQGGCSLVQGRRVLLRLGDREEAGRLLEAVQRNKFDRVCKLGDPGREAMTVFVRSR